MTNNEAAPAALVVWATAGVWGSVIAVGSIVRYQVTATEYVVGGKKRIIEMSDDGKIPSSATK